jgi:DNA-binding NtrC family response regulator
LIIDDQPDVRGAMVELVAAVGHCSVGFHTGSAARDHLIAGHQADAAMIDLVMPGMTGVETIAALRALRPDIAIVLVSGHPDLRRAATGLRNVALLPKPFRIAQLDAALEVAMSLVQRPVLH